MSQCHTHFPQHYPSLSDGRLPRVSFRSVESDARHPFQGFIFTTLRGASYEAAGPDTPLHAHVSHKAPRRSTDIIISSHQNRFCPVRMVISLPRPRPPPPVHKEGDTLCCINTPAGDDDYRICSKPPTSNPFASLPLPNQRPSPFHRIITEQVTRGKTKKNTNTSTHPPSPASNPMPAVHYTPLLSPFLSLSLSLLGVYPTAQNPW